MSPLHFLAATAGVTLVAWVIHRLLRRRHRRFLRHLAAQWKFRFVEADLFHLAGRIGGRFPVAGAADLRVFDVLYCSLDNSHCYVFTAEFCVPADGVARQRLAAAFSEPRETSGQDGIGPVFVADEDLALIDQYRSLYERHHGRPQSG